MRNEDVALRLNSVKRLPTIALALGPERTREELLPFLQNNDDDDDEVLLAVAEELGNFVPLVGGPEHAHSLLPTLEALASVDETVVRDAAVTSLRKVGKELAVEDMLHHFKPLIHRLSAREWTARVSGVQLISVAYPPAPEPFRGELRLWFEALANDETPMVRRAAAAAFGGFVEVVEPEVVMSELLRLFKKLSTDDQDSVRLITVESCSPLAKSLPSEAVEQHILPALLQFSEDKSWRIRYNSALQLPTVAEIVGPSPRHALVLAFVKVLGDSEAEVRSAAASKISAFAELISQADCARLLLPRCRELAQDVSQYVRTSLAQVLTALTPRLGKEVTTRDLLPILLDLLSDESPDVRLGVIANLDAVSQVVGVDLLSQNLLPAVEGLAQDGHWRVRLAIISHVPLLAIQLGPDFLQNKLGPQCVAWLQDPVYSIREAAIKAVEDLAKHFGSEWAQELLSTDIIKALRHENYLYRETALNTVAALGPTVQKNFLLGVLLPAVKTVALEDVVPNVRFNGAKVLERLLPLMEASAIERELKPCLISMGGDADADVRYFAARALLATETAIAGGL